MEVQRTMKTHLELEEIALLEKAATNLRDRLLIRLLFHLGCRVSEALSLQVKDIDFAQNAVTIQHLKSRIELTCSKCGAKLGRSHAFCPKCGTNTVNVLTAAREHRRMRTLPVDGLTLKMLKEYLERGGPVLRDGKRLIFGINRHRGWQIILADNKGLR